MDLSTTTEPRSDQQNYDDYIGGPKTVTIDKVTAGNAEQPVDIHLVEFPGRPYKPSKSMRRVLVAAWGKDSSVYTGRTMTLYGDPTVKFGGQTVGGIKISHLSHIDGPVKVALTVTRGKRAPHVVKPIENTPAPSKRGGSASPRSADAPPTLTPDMVAASTDINQLRQWQQDEPRAHDAIEARIRQIAAEQVSAPADDTGELPIDGGDQQ